MLKIRFFIIFLVAHTILFAVALESQKLKDVVTLAPSIDSGHTDLDVKNFPLFFVFSILKLNHIFLTKIDRLEIITQTNDFNATLFQLLESNRIALPPPSMA